jgi:hypothetical protein
MIKTANVFKIPIIVTEQKRKVFGDTEEKIKKNLDKNVDCFEK